MTPITPVFAPAAIGPGSRAAALRDCLFASAPPKAARTKAEAGIARAGTR